MVGWPGESITSSENNSRQSDHLSTSTLAQSRSENLQRWLPTIFAATAYLILIARMDRLLWDADIYWHIVVGRWIIENRAVPHVDVFSFTMRGVPWISSAWLSQVLYYIAFKLA